MKIVLVVIAVVLVVLGGYSVWALTHPTTLRTEIEIAASPDTVWEVLADRDAYAEWNPFILSSTGDLVVGRRIANVLKDGAGKESTFEPELLVVEPGRELRWIGKVGFGGIFDGEHAFRIEPAGPGRVRFIQEERFRGVAVPVMRGWLNDKIKPQFDAMNTALATRVQSR
ncbi:MAG: SRPBCC family protein [Kribbellaceae bacterium]